MKIAVVGAGVVGSLTALMLRRGGGEVSLLSASQAGSAETCSFAAGGMLSPIAEAVYGREEIALAGWDSVERWGELVATLDQKFLFGRYGSVVYAARQHHAELQEWVKRLEQKFPSGPWQVLSGDGMQDLEPGLEASAAGVLHLKNEGFVDCRAVLAALSQALVKEGVAIEYGRWVERVDEGVIHSGADAWHYDMVIDCRGLGAQHEVRGLRGMRGEALLVYAPDVTLQRPIRVLHPRYPIYVVPRGGGHYYIGATVIESESLEPISVQSLLEILTGLYQFHPGFRYAHVTQTLAQVRPAFDDHEPRLVTQTRLLRLNGLYRHGFLLGPIVAQAAADLVYGRSLDPRIQPWVQSSSVNTTCG
jgi:glycine oxidase